MTWYDSNFKQRKPVTIDASAGDGGESVVDVEIEIPKTWDLFWENIRSDFADVVPADLDGDVIPFQRKTGANYSTRTLTLQLDSVKVKTASMNQIFLYFQHDSASDISGSVTITGEKNGFIDITKPGGFIVKRNLNGPATQRPVTSFTKSVADVVDVYFSTQGILRNMTSAYQGRNDFENIKNIQVRSLNNSGVDNTGRFELDKCRFLSGYVKVRIKSGSDGTDYALSLLITTSEDQIIDLRCLIQVRDQLPE